MRSFPEISALALCCSIALLAGCGGSQPPIGAPGVTPQGGAIAQRVARGNSWVLPKAKGANLLYVTNSGYGSYGDGGSVSVFSYPEGNLVGQLTAFSNPNGACVDGAGNVFITDTNERSIFEYVHGGSKAIRTLTDAQQPSGCAIDPNTEKLAVANIDGSVAVYRNARGAATIYHDPILIDAYYCAYDGDGNLFVDGFNYYNRRHNFQLAELSHGKRQFTNVSTNAGIVTPTGVQWDGKYIAIGDGSNNHAVYRLQVTGSEGIVKGKVSLSNTSPEGFWVDGKRLINPDYFKNQVEFFRYPAGGPTRRVITSGVGLPSAAAVSRAKI